MSEPQARQRRAGTSQQPDRQPGRAAAQDVPTLYGLVLAGGESSRMRRDKATLDYHGRPQLQWAYELLSQLCAATYVSVRAEQRDEPLRASYPQIVDREVGAGPAGGITAALLAHPQVAWLVVACDLPLLTPATLHDLIGRRDPQRLATAYRSSHDGLPEPLCAIWEPAAREPLLAYLQARAAAGKKSCPRKFLIDSDIRLLELPQGDALDNVNTPEEHDMTRERLRAARLSAPDDGPRSGGTPAASGSVPDAPPDSSARGATRTLRVQYYAILREQAGRSEETLDTAASTPTELFEELRRRHPFRLSPGQLKVALNAEFRDWDTPLQHGDTVVFIPPVAGG